MANLTSSADDTYSSAFDLCGAYIFFLRGGRYEENPKSQDNAAESDQLQSHPQFPRVKAYLALRHCRRRGANGPVATDHRVDQPLPAKPSGFLSGPEPPVDANTTRSSRPWVSG